MKLGKRLRRALAFAGAALAGVVLPMTITVDQAQAYVPPSAIKAVKILPKIAAGAGTAEEAGTALVPLRFLAMDNPVTGTIMILGTAAWFWMNHTQSGQTVKKKLWDWVDSQGWVGQGDEVAGNYCTRYPPPAGSLIFTATDNSVIIPPGTGVQTAAGKSVGVTCLKTLGTAYGVCRSSVAWSSYPAGYVWNLGLSSTSYSPTGQGPANIVATETIPNACSGTGAPGGGALKLVGVSITAVGSPTDNSVGAFYPNPNNPSGTIPSTTQVTATKTCIAADGTQADVSATSAVGDMSIPNVDCPVGSAPMKQKVQIKYPGGVTKTVGTTTINQTQAAKYPQCLGAGSTGCAFWIEYNGQQCTVGMPGCATWWDVAQRDGATVVCHWGPYSMPVFTDCEPIRHAYVTTYGAATQPDQDGETQTDTKTRPIIDDDGSLWPTTMPYPGENTVTDPTTGTDPGTSTGTDPGTSTGTDPATIPDGDGAECWPGGTAAFNPLEWVYMPVKCVLVWAFEPSPQAVDRLTGRATSQLTALTAWQQAATGLAGAFTIPAGTDCMGPAVSLGEPFNKTIYPAQSCSGPAANLAAVSRAGSTAGLILAAAFSSFYAIAQGFGYTAKKFQTDSSAGKGK